MTTKIEMANASGVKKGRSNTPGLNYSSSLKEKPIGSFNFISPLIMNSTPTIILDTQTKYFILLLLNESMQKLHN